MEIVNNSEYKEGLGKICAINLEKKALPSPETAHSSQIYMIKN